MPRPSPERARKQGTVANTTSASYRHPPPGDAADEPGKRQGQTSALPRFLERHERIAFVLILLAGLVARIAWVSQEGRLGPMICETYNVAVCFARTGSICDPYFPGQGPTAFVNPVLPAMIGLVYRTFGIGSLTSEVLLTAFSLSAFSVTLVALYLAFRRLGVAIEWRFAALAMALFLPMNFKWETVSMRLFEGGVAAALLAISLLIVLRMDARSEPLRARDYTLPAGLVGLLALINPPAALGAYAALGVLTLRRVPVRRWVSVALVMTVGLAIFIVPWGLRNEREFGRLILSRSNFPLEHAIGFHAAAVSPQDPAAVFRARAYEVHPYSDNPAAPARAEVARIGDLAYMDKLAAQTTAWERAHPVETVFLAARHLGEFWFPPTWSWRIHSDNSPMVTARQIFTWTITLAAIGAVVWRLVQSPLGPGLYVACVLIVPSLPYALVQPIQRYRYLVVVLTLFLAADFASRAAAQLAARRPFSVWTRRRQSGDT